MAEAIDQEETKFIPGSDVESEDIFKYPYTVDDETIDFLQNHKQIMFIVRGFPGTGKNSLADMLVRRYPSAVVLSADNYYTDTFNNKKRDPQSLRRSHEYCHRKVETACKKNQHPIIVKNTHVRKCELQTYLDFAATHNYIVIMACTNNKFQVTTENLTRSNTKGLNEEYFKSRLLQWEEIVPILTGWFLSPEDSTHLLQQLQIALDALLGDGRFCRLLKFYDKGEIFEHYSARKLLYCVAACCKNNVLHQLKSHYLSRNVSQHRGQCFQIVIEGYLVTSVYIFAIVKLNGVMKNLRYIKSSIRKQSESQMDSLTKKFHSTSLSDNFRKYSTTINFNVELKGKGITFERLKRRASDAIDTKSCSFMHLAESARATNELLQPDLFFDLLAVAADKTGNISGDEFMELEDDYKVCRLASDAWLVKPPFKLAYKTVFTGLYV